MRTGCSRPGDVCRNRPRSDVKALKGALKGRYRLSVGKWRIFSSFEQPDTVVVSEVDNRGQAY